MKTPPRTSTKYLSLYRERTTPRFFASSISLGNFMYCFSDSSTSGKQLYTQTSERIEKMNMMTRIPIAFRVLMPPPTSLDFLAVSFAAFFAVLVFVDPFFIPDIKKRLSIGQIADLKRTILQRKQIFKEKTILHRSHVMI